MADRQLPFLIISATVTSGQPVVLNMASPYVIVGVTPIVTNGAQILTFQTNNNNGNFTVTVTMNVTTAKISFLCVGVNR